MPALSETFVYREMLGLRELGRPTLAASLYPPRVATDDAILSALAAESLVIYRPARIAMLPLALARHPRQLARAFREALHADHPSLASRLKHLWQAAMGIAIGARLRGRGIGHVHAHMANAPTMVALYVARALGVPFSFTGHAADLFVQRAALRFKLEHAAFVACISHWHRDVYRAIAPQGDARLPIVRCSVAMPSATLPESREVVAVARLIPKKGIDLLLRAFAAAPALADWQLRLLGDGPDRAALEVLSAELKLSARVKFMGARPHRECLAAIANAGIFALPCRTAANGDKDGIPVVLMEAMAASRAVIAGDLPAIRELIDDGQSGLLVAPDSVASLASALDALARDPALRNRLGTAARAKVAQEFSDGVNWQRLLAAIGVDYRDLTPEPCPQVAA